MKMSYWKLTLTIFGVASLLASPPTRAARDETEAEPKHELEYTYLVGATSSGRYNLQPAFDPTLWPFKPITVDGKAQPRIALTKLDDAAPHSAMCILTYKSRNPGGTDVAFSLVPTSGRTSHGIDAYVMDEVPAYFTIKVERQKPDNKDDVAYELMSVTAFNGNGGTVTVVPYKKISDLAGKLMGNSIYPAQGEPICLTSVGANGVSYEKSCSVSTADLISKGDAQAEIDLGKFEKCEKIMTPPCPATYPNWVYCTTGGVSTFCGCKK